MIFPRSLPLALLAVLCALSLTSCLNSSTTIIVGKDGSGTIEERSLAGAKFVALWDRLAQSLGGLLGESASSLASSNPILQSDSTYTKRSSSYGEGVTFESAEELKDPNGDVGALVRYRFDDVTRLRIKAEDTLSALETLKSAVPVQITGMPDLQGGFGQAPITFSFASGEVSTLGIHLPAPDQAAIREASAKAKMPDPAKLEEAREFLGELKFGLFVRTEGEIVSSEASHRKENTITLLELDFGKLLDDPEAFAKLQAIGKEGPSDEAAEQLLAVEGITFETKESIETRFE